MHTEHTEQVRDESDGLTRRGTLSASVGRLLLAYLTSNDGFCLPTLDEGDVGIISGGQDLFVEQGIGIVSGSRADACSETITEHHAPQTLVT